MSGYWYGECSKCYARQLAYSKDHASAITRWNTRNCKAPIDKANDMSIIAPTLTNTG